jgi:fructose-1,6-bisphosphatase/sedoheptulose 1,7-bisphosphatase-like protein
LAADQAAVDAMRRAMEGVSFSGRIVMGQGERDEVPTLYVGEQIGSGDGGS